MSALQLKFVETLQNELAHMSRLEAVLKVEKTALEQRNVDLLKKNTQEKQSLISSIESLSQERSNLLQAAGVAPDKASVLAFIQAQPALKAKWDELEAVLERCQKQNQVNGMILEKGKQQTQELLNILLGEGQRKGAEVYDAKGTTSSSFLNGRSVKV